MSESKYRLIGAFITLLILLSVLLVYYSPSEEDEITPRNIITDYPFADYYPSLNEYYEFFHNLTEVYPDLVKLEKYGESYEGRDLYVVKVSDNVQVDEQEPEVLIDGGIHAREWSGPQAASYFLWRITREYDSNETIQWMVDHREIFVAPMLNPDGYVYDGDGYLDERREWRKNRNDSTPTSGVGVDLNRNFPIKFWEGDNNPHSLTYKGEAPFSEPETKNYRDWVLSMDIQSYTNLHTYGGIIFIPWGYSGEDTPHHGWYMEAAKDMSSFTTKMGNNNSHYIYGQSEDIFGGGAPGLAHDWVYQKTGAHGFTVEIDTGEETFYPPENRIMTINTDVDDALIYQTRIADADLGDGNMELHPADPYLVYGNVETEDGEPLKDEMVVITNEDTGEQLWAITDENGYYEINFSNFVENWYGYDDEYTLSVVGEGSTFTIKDSWGQREDIQVDLSGGGTLLIDLSLDYYCNKVFLETFPKISIK